jgi:hypothetical protein
MVKAATGPSSLWTLRLHCWKLQLAPEKSLLGTMFSTTRTWSVTDVCTTRAAERDWGVPDSQPGGCLLDGATRICACCCNVELLLRGLYDVK